MGNATTGSILYMSDPRTWSMFDNSTKKKNSTAQDTSGIALPSIIMIYFPGYVSWSEENQACWKIRSYASSILKRIAVDAPIEMLIMLLISFVSCRELTLTIHSQYMPYAGKNRISMKFNFYIADLWPKSNVSPSFHQNGRFQPHFNTP